MSISEKSYKGVDARTRTIGSANGSKLDDGAFALPAILDASMAAEAARTAAAWTAAARASALSPAAAAAAAAVAAADGIAEEVPAPAPVPARLRDSTELATCFRMKAVYFGGKLPRLLSRIHHRAIHFSKSVRKLIQRVCQRMALGHFRSDL